MCKQKCEQCKCKRGTPKEIIEGSFNVIGVEKPVDYDKYIMTTSPNHIRNRVDVESETLTVEDENLHLIDLGIVGVPPEGEE
ncbi:hypothetical protein VP14_218 [Vibrio phage VPMCC14]|nr:hypothetical protein VP14_218 [Vibrio phage VPMCC14]